MRFFPLAAVALAAVPSVLATQFPKEFDHIDFLDITTIIDTKYHAADHKHQHHGSKHHDSNPEAPKAVELTASFVCERLNHFANETDEIHDYVKKIKCGKNDRKCWEPVVKAIYDLEWELFLFDTSLAKTDLDKCLDCKSESKVATCYHRYSNSLIAALDIIAEQIEYLNGETAYFIVTAVNSFRAADYTFVYELVRRMQCEEYQKDIMKKQGAIDGSTPGSIREAFALFVSTPYITGDDFRVEKGKKEPKKEDIDVVEKIKIKCRERFHHHHDHHPGHHHGHHHPHHHHHRPGRLDNDKNHEIIKIKKVD